MQMPAACRRRWFPTACSGAVHLHQLHVGVVSAAEQVLQLLLLHLKALCQLQEALLDLHEGTTSETKSSARAPPNNCSCR